MMRLLFLEVQVEDIPTTSPKQSKTQFKIFRFKLVLPKIGLSPSLLNHYKPNTLYTFAFNGSFAITLFLWVSDVSTNGFIDFPSGICDAEVFRFEVVQVHEGLF